VRKGKGKQYKESWLVTHTMALSYVFENVPKGSYIVELCPKSNDTTIRVVKSAKVKANKGTYSYKTSVSKRAYSS
jgi:hypothetical protein